jgi:4-hydroxy-tetrahydrodipicolinate synthase
VSEPAAPRAMQRRGTPSTFVISQTHFAEDGSVDWGATRAHLERMKEAGVGVYVGGGGSGEGHALLPAEVDRLLALGAEVLVDAVPARAMGVEPRTARQMIEFGHQVEASGLEAMQIYCLDVGHLAVPTPQEQEAYFSEVIEAVRIPTVLSTHFSVGYMVPIDVLVRLCERSESVAGINCSIGQDFGYLVRLLEEVDPRIEVHVGGPVHTLSALALGATGYLSSEANLAPKLAQSLVDRYAAGDHRAAEEAYSKIVRLSAMPLTAGSADGKALQRSLGLPAGHPRRPRLDRSTPESVAAARRRLRAIGIPELEPYLAD